MDIENILGNIEKFFDSQSKEELDIFFSEFDDTSDDDIDLEEFLSAYQSAYRILDNDLIESPKLFEIPVKKMEYIAKTINLKDFVESEPSMAKISGLKNVYSQIEGGEWLKAG